MLRIRVASPPPGLESNRGETWFEQAACRQEDLRLFFEPENESQAQRAERVRAAKAVCRWCPVRGECLAFALAEQERYGVWGGLTARERSTLRQRCRPGRHGERRGSGAPPAGSPENRRLPRFG